MTKTLRLKYLPAGIHSTEKAQPCVVVPNDNKQPFRAVPIAPIVPQDCIGCVGEHNPFGYSNINCENIPDCVKAIYVRATPANKLKHIAWLLDQHS
jgi:hypothetical protein